MAMRRRAFQCLFLVGLTLLAGSPARAAAQQSELPPEVAARVFDPAIDVDELALRLVPLSDEELAEVAAGWFEIVKAKTAEMIEAQLILESVADADAQDARDRLVELSAERQALAGAFTAVLASWELKGGDADTIAGYRAYKTAVGIEQARHTDLQTLWQQVAEWAVSREGGVGFLMSALVVVVALLALVLVARLARRITARAAGRAGHISKLLVSFLSLAVYWIVLAIGLLIVLSALGVDITPLFALIGGASFILAFAMQSTLSNLASGLLIMINRPFDEGDLVEVGDVLGRVERVSIVSTTIVTPDNKVVAVPNSQVWGNVITNYTGSETRRVDLVFGIGYDDNIETAQRVLEQTTAQHPLVLDDPAAVIRVSELADSSVNFIVRPWVKQEDYWTVYWDLTRQVKEAFDANGISIPFPQQDINVRNTERPFDQPPTTGGEADATRTPAETALGEQT